MLVDATVPLAAAIGGRATRTLGVWQGSAAQQAEEMAPRGVTVVSALHTVSAAALSDPSIEMDEDVLIAGDDRKAKDDVAELIRRIPGLRPVDCGDLEMRAHPRAAHAAADLGQQAPQDQALGHPDHRPRLP